MINRIPVCCSNKLLSSVQLANIVGIYYQYCVMCMLRNAAEIEPPKCMRRTYAECATCIFYYRKETKVQQQLHLISHVEEMLMINLFGYVKVATNSFHRCCVTYYISSEFQL